MTLMSDEKRMSKALQKGLDMVSFDPNLVIIDFSLRNTNMQMRMMDLILSFIDYWAARYVEGSYDDNPDMQRTGRMAHDMLCALSTPGRHAKGRRRLP